MGNKPAWQTGLDMTRSHALAKSLHVTQEELEARQASEARQVAADQARKPTQAERMAHAYRADLYRTIREAFTLSCGELGCYMHEGTPVHSSRCTDG